jgi:hypothetical protein
LLQFDLQLTVRIDICASVQRLLISVTHTRMHAHWIVITFSLCQHYAFVEMSASPPPPPPFVTWAVPPSAPPTQLDERGAADTVSSAVSASLLDRSCLCQRHRSLLSS